MLLVFCSSRGSINDESPRRHVPTLVMCRYLLVFLEVVQTDFGILNKNSCSLISLPERMQAMTL